MLKQIGSIVEIDGVELSYVVDEGKKEFYDGKLENGKWVVDVGYKSLNNDLIQFDINGHLDPQKLEQEGYTYKSIWATYAGELCWVREGYKTEADYIDAIVNSL